MGTAIVGLILLCVVIAIIKSMIKDKKNGKSSCGGSCGHCGSHSMCENPKAFFDQIKKEQFSK